MRSAQEIFRPYFCLIGQSKRRALSRFALSGQLLRGAKRCVPVGAGTVPRHADEKGPIVAIIGRPPGLRIRHQDMEVFDHRVQVEALELVGIVELLVHRIGQRGVLVQDLQAQLIRLPSRIPRGRSHRVSASPVGHRALLLLMIGDRHPYCRREFFVHVFTLFGKLVLRHLTGSTPRSALRAQPTENEFGFAKDALTEGSRRRHCRSGRK
jgi:hypothetical protein